MKLHYSTYCSDTKVITGIHDSGFFSCINCVRVSLYKLISRGIIPERVSFANTLYSYKSNPDQDLYPLLYKTDFSQLNFLNTKFDYELFCTSAYNHKDIDFKNFNPIEKVYFNPSNLVEEKTNQLIQKYNIDFNNTIAVFHRGNDKWRETSILNTNTWIDIIKQIHKPGEKILIQTDERKTRDAFISYFKDDCFFFEEMLFEDTPYTNVKPIQQKEKWAIEFDSVVRLLSKCKKLLNHTGNCAFVPTIYRGNLKGEMQVINNSIHVYSK